MKRLLFLVLLVWMTPASAQTPAVSREANRALIWMPSPEIWSLSPWKRRLRIQTRATDSNSAALSRDGKLVALGRDDSTIELFETHSGRLWKRLGKPQVGRDRYSVTLDEYAVRTLDFSPHRKWLATGNRKGLFVWRVRDGKLLFSRRFPRNDLGNFGSIGLVKFSPDARRIAVAARHNSPVYLFEMKRKRFGRPFRINAEDGSAQAMAFSRDGRRLAVASHWSVSASSHGQIHVFSTRSGRTLWFWSGASENPQDYDMGAGFDSVAWSRDGKRVAFGSDLKLEIRAARDGKLLLSRSGTWKQKQMRRFHAAFAVR